MSDSWIAKVSAAAVAAVAAATVIAWKNDGALGRAWSRALDRYESTNEVVVWTVIFVGALLVGGYLAIVATRVLTWAIREPPYSSARTVIPREFVKWLLSVVVVVAATWQLINLYVR